jgi:hypothetical protein
MRSARATGDAPHKNVAGEAKPTYLSARRNAAASRSARIRPKTLCSSVLPRARRPTLSVFRGREGHGPRSTRSCGDTERPNYSLAESPSHGEGAEKTRLAPSAQRTRGSALPELAGLRGLGVSAISARRARLAGPTPAWAGVQGRTGIENTSASESSGARVLDSRVPFTARSAVGPIRILLRPPLPDRASPRAPRETPCNIREPVLKPLQSILLCLGVSVLISLRVLSYLRIHRTTRGRSGRT